MKGETMNQQNSRRPYRPLFEELAIKPELVTPLSGPSYGPFNVARQRWRKPLPAIIADALANSRALLSRLDRGMYMPDEEGKSRYKAIFDELYRRTHEQVKALETFSQVGWRE
jgi:hypothetical protein